jgi:urea carboxylase-associated protein 1
MRAQVISRTSPVSKLKAGSAVYNEMLAAGEAWIHEIKAGQIFRIVAIGGSQAVDTLFYSAWDTSERYSAQDTILAQRNIYLKTGTRLMSNIGRPMLTIVGDSFGRHDTLTGACAAQSNQVRYTLDKRYMHNCRDNFLAAIASWRTSLDKRDLSPNVNFFLHAPVTPDGELSFSEGITEPGRYVELRADMDVIALVSACPQLNNSCNAFNPSPIRLMIWDV